jgi:MFS transporter, DHA2 family, multidrug resistance protein
MCRRSPSIGGWLSEYHGWRSIFYLSLPIAGFILLVVGLSLPEKRAEQNPPFDFFGLMTFLLGMIGLQMLLDRGERLEWFNSAEIWAEVIASMLGFYLYLVHVLTTKAHFLDKACSRTATSSFPRSCSSRWASSCCQPWP